MKKKWIILIVTLVVVGALGIGGGVAYALWQEKTTDAAWFELAVDVENPSLKYQIFVPIDVQGNRVAGEYEVSASNGQISRNYVMESTLVANVDALAFVGWEGGIALDYIIIPEEFTVSINGAEYTLPVKRAIVDADFRAYYVRGDSVIKRIELPANMTYLAAGVFAYVENLEEVIVKGDAQDEPLTIAKSALVGCLKLRAVVAPDERVIQEEEY